MSGEKPRYRVLRLSHIHNTLWPEGAEIEYEGEPVIHRAINKPQSVR